MKPSLHNINFREPCSKQKTLPMDNLAIEYAFKYGAMKSLLELLPTILHGQGIINSKQSVKVHEYIQEQLKDTQKRYEKYIENKEKHQE